MTRPLALAFAAATALAARSAEAHVSIVSGIGVANATQEVTFGVGHGCTTADTYKVRVQIPASVTSVRPMRSDFGKVSVEKDGLGTITAVVWQKADADALDEDLAYYKLVIRLKTPNQPLTTLVFPSQQTCRAANGTLSTVGWTMLPGAPVADGGADEPAPTLALAPARRPGWNKVTAAAAVTDLAAYFGDALIVWKGAAAWSPSPATTDLIKATAGVTPLTTVAANDELWVKY
jgi:periplasmic copper chaperone A